MKFGIDRLLEDPALRAPLAGRRVALLAHPASVTRDLVHSLDALAALGDIKLTAAFGPQHGLRGDKQDNMIESPDFTDPVHGIPVFSLYGEVRRPTAAMMDSFDVLLVDLQDVGCRIYTFVTTLRYVLEAAAAARQGGLGARPPQPGRASGRGTAAARRLGELRRRRTAADAPRADARRARAVVRAHAWPRCRPRGRDDGGLESRPAPGYGWPLGERAWVNPSPNAANLSMARCYAGTVMLEGTTLSEGRGTTRPLELFGAPDLDPRALLAAMQSLAPGWMRGCRLRPCWFEPTFHKHVGSLCAGLQIHVDDPSVRSRRVSPVAARRARVQGDPHAAPRTTSCGATSRTSTSAGASPST